jgi:hypothetical protein
VAGEISYADLLERLPLRSWDGIESQARVLGLSLRHRPVHYRLLDDERDIVSQGNRPGNGVRTIGRASMSVRLPAWLMALGAMNPYLCGQIGHPENTRTCPPMNVKK